jgi:hypothetical protein
MKYLAAAVVLAGLAASPARADVLQLSFDNGYVTISANNAPVREILAEWARRGQTRIVNGDRLTSTVTLELPHVPEKQALETLLRSAGGYMAAARPAATQGLSQFDRIIVMPTAPGNPVRAVAAPVPQQPAPVADPGAMVDDQDDPIQPPGIQQPGVQPPGYPHPDQPIAEQPANAQPPAMPAPMSTPGIQPMPPQMQPGQGAPAQPVQPNAEDPDEEDAQPPAPGAVPGGQGVLVSPVPGQLPMPAPQPNPR